MGSNIIVLGSVNTDLVIRGPRLPAPGETVLGGAFYEAPGGKGANQAVAAMRAAAEESSVIFLAAVGDDLYGRAARSRLEAEGINCRYMKSVPAQPTGVALILVDHAGNNLISVAEGANAYLTPDDIDAVPDELFVAGGVLLASLESPLSTVVRALERGRAAGLLTILNPAPASSAVVCHAVLRNVDICTPNETEAELLAGTPVRTRDDLISTASRFRELGCLKTVFTLGPRGCLVASDEVLEIPAHSVEAIDTTAAGDAFNGAMAVALSEGQSLPTAARWANRAAAISVARRGAQPSLPRREEIDGEFPPAQQ